MRKYEIMYIIKPSLDEAATKKVIDSFKKVLKDHKAQIIEAKEIGLKDLAYEIQKFRKGFYVWMRVEANQETIAEFNRLIGINENIIRDIVIREDE